MFLTGRGSRSPRSRLVALSVVFLLALPVVSTFAPSSSGSSVVSALPSPKGFRVVGPAPQNLPILVTLAIPLRNVAALDTLVMQVSNPTSPEYRHFLTPQQAQKEFLPTARFEGLVSSLKSNGFQIQLTALDSVVVVEGTVRQFSSAFGGEINTYTNGTASYYASSGVTTFNGAYLYASNGTFLFAKPAVSTPRPSGNVTFTEGTFSAKDLQQVYNATSFISRGQDGKGQTIGLLDYYGSPTLSSDLKLFDSTFGFSNASLNIIPVGPYDPSLGANVGWSTEVALDVEASHAMAPGATIDDYVANGALPLSVPLAKIVQDDKVTTLSQSFGYYEWYYSQSYNLGGPGFLAVYGLIPDQYYALGSAEGITFLASSGDGGGSGYSSGPEGNVEYPSSSPFVTSVGGTQTYFSRTPGGGITITQTAWSNIGYVPNLVNAGGGGGGVSILEPRPWYQSKQATPPSYPKGRMNPDVSLQAGVDPATEIVDSGRTIGEGGTSESSPLLAGLLTLMAQSLNGHLGLINPFLYKVGNDPATYTKGFTPITFGYIIPWRASFGYNLATGWGSPNVGELATFLNSTSPSANLDVRGTIYNSTGEGQLGYIPGQNLTVSAKISNAGTTVTSGSFTVELQTLRGTYSPTAMAYDATTGNWTATIGIGQEAGFTYVYVSGASGAGVPGEAMGTIFTGYVATLTATGSAYSLPIDPWSWDSGHTLSLTVFTSDIRGFAAPAGSVGLSVEPYSISSNSYSNSSQVSLTGTGTGAVDGYLSAPAPAGPVSLVTQGDTYGYAPMVSGIYLQSGYIYPSVAAEPGSVAPGQYITIIANPIAPVNVYFETSFETGRQFAYDVFVGSNVTARLVASNGTTLSTATLAYQPCAQALRVCNGGASVIYGQLQVPVHTSPGLHTVLLHAAYGSLTPGGNLTGNFYGQVWVAPATAMATAKVVPGVAQVLSIPPPTVSGVVPTGLYEGQQAHVDAMITYANSTVVKTGEFTAIIYPESLEGSYINLMHTEYAGGHLIQLHYDPAFQDWIGNVTLPGPTDQGGASGLGLGSLDPAGPWEVYVTGLTSDGVPTSSTLGAQQPFSIQPYAYVTGTTRSLPANSSMAFSRATISASGTLTGNEFLVHNEIQDSTVTIARSSIEGVLVLTNSNVTLEGVSGGSVIVDGSSLILKDSSVGSINVVNGTVTMVDSSYGQVTPALPTFGVRGLAKPISAVGTYNVTVSGSGLGPGSLSAWVDGAKVNLQVTTMAGGLAATGKVNATSLNDGVHSLVLTARQSDGLSSTITTTFSTNAHQLALEKQTSTLFDLVYVVAGVGIAALVVGVVALLRRKPRTPATTPGPAPYV